jgi:beta-glucanase (GH16 family)
MLPTDNVYDFWPRSGEIDIVENANGDARISGAIHYKNPGKVNETSHTYQFASNSLATATDWNIYAVEWHQDEMRWYLNGQPYFSRQRQSWNNGLYPVDPISDHAPFDQDFHLILNLALKDDALGSGVNINPAHYTGGQEMRVDYVKVYACSAGPNFCQHE